MNKMIIINGLNYWRTEAKRILGHNASDIILSTAFDPSESAESLGEKFQLCLREFALAFKRAEKLDVYAAFLSRTLEAGYEKAGAQSSAGIDEFLKYVVERDNLIGLEAGGRKISSEMFSYWIKDMFFPLCKDRRLTEKEYATISTNGYLRTKINYFLPDPKN